MDAQEILQKVLHETRKSRAALAKSIELPPYRLQDIARGKSKEFPYEVADKIASVYPQFNREWLLTGEGDMLLPQAADAGSDAAASLTDGVYIFDEEQYKKAQSTGMKIVPEYSDSFRGGNWGDMISSDRIVAYWGFPKINASIVVEVDGDSMAPRYPSGSKVALREITFDKTFPTSGIPFGEVFGIIVDNGGEQPVNFIKILRRHPDRLLSSKYWVAQSVNKEKYDDFEIEIQKVRHLFVVVAGVSLNRI